MEKNKNKEEEIRKGNGNNKDKDSNGCSKRGNETRGDIDRSASKGKN